MRADQGVNQDENEKTRERVAFHQRNLAEELARLNCKGRYLRVAGLRWTAGLERPRTTATKVAGMLVEITVWGLSSSSLKQDPTSCFGVSVSPDWSLEVWVVIRKCPAFLIESARVA